METQIGAMEMQIGQGKEGSQRSGSPTIGNPKMHVAYVAIRLEQNPPRGSLSSSRSSASEMVSVKFSEWPRSGK